MVVEWANLSPNLLKLTQNLEVNPFKVQSLSSSEHCNLELPPNIINAHLRVLSLDWMIFPEMHTGSHIYVHGLVPWTFLIKETDIF